MTLLRGIAFTSYTVKVRTLIFLVTMIIITCHKVPFSVIVLQMLAESLCAILLLEESSPRQVFSEFILSRKATLQEIFHPCQHGKVSL